ncbi:MAG TPA: hypothetical protein VF680_16885 [Allosphingosinicella sp.]|jgi:hypothetical protein
MEEQKNFSWEEVVAMSENFPWEPSFNGVIITLNRKEPDGELVLSDNEMDEVQFIVAKGPHVHTYNTCDTVMLDLEKMMEYVPNPSNQDEKIGRLKFTPVYDDDDNMFAIIQDRQILCRRKQDQQLQSEI